MKESRVAIASVYGFGNQSSDIGITNAMLFSYRRPYIQVSVLIGGTKGLFFLKKKMFKSTYYSIGFFSFRQMCQWCSQ